MTHLRRTIGRGISRRWTGLGLTASGMSLAAVLMASQLLWLRSLGPICGHHGFAVTHCPGCYAAMAVALAGLALAGAPSGAVTRVAYVVLGRRTARGLA